jgi:hypothetical protein
MKKILTVVLVCCLGFMLFGCTTTETGSLSFYVNGEDFVRNGFTSKDGYNLTFDSIEINLDNITAYQVESEEDITADGVVDPVEEVALGETVSVDLKEGDEPILVGTVDDVPVGQYNSISWDMINNSDGYTIVIKGEAEKDGTITPFEISLSDEIAFYAGEYVGDERKGFVETDSEGDLEMTFHFDHLFGDGTIDAEDTLNTDAIGFEPFMAYEDGGEIVVTTEDLSAEDSEQVSEILLTLGHVGEGHAYSTEIGQE